MHQKWKNFPTNSINHAYETRNKDSLQIPVHHLKRIDQGMDFWGPKLYNKLPSEFHDKSLMNFKREVKRLLLNETIYSIEVLIEKEYVMRFVFYFYCVCMHVVTTVIFYICLLLSAPFVILIANEDPSNLI